MEVDGKAITRENKLQQWARWGTWGADAWGGICGDGREIAIDPQGTPLPSLHRSVDGINSHTSQWEGEWYGNGEQFPNCRPIIYPPVKRSTPSPPYFPTTTISLMAPSLQISSPLSSALLNWPCWLKKEPSIPTPPTLPPRSSLVAKFQSSQQRATELATLAEEGPAMRGEVARLRMELGLVAQAQRERDQHVVVRKGGLGGGRARGRWLA